MPSIGSVVMGASDVRRAAAFWTQALGYVPREEPEDDWVVLVSPQGTGAQLSIGLSETPVQERPRTRHTGSSRVTSSPSRRAFRQACMSTISA